VSCLGNFVAQDSYLEYDNLIALTMLLLITPNSRGPRPQGIEPCEVWDPQLQLLYVVSVLADRKK